jgi:hypothetical protein
MNGLADDLLKLRFVPRPLQSLYLNKDRVAERFTSHLGAIDAWTRRADREGGGGVDLKVVRADVRGGRGDELSYDLQDITVRALLLRDALQDANVIRSPDTATVGQYVIASGRSCLRNPDLLRPILLAHDERCLAETDPRFFALEEDRARAEAILLALAGPASSNDRMWMLTLGHGADVTAAATLNSSWIDYSVVSYIHFNWTMFGTLREHIGGVPTLAAIHIWANMPEDVMKPEGPG